MSARAVCGANAKLIREVVPEVVLGSDVGKTGTVRIDATNGLFLLESQRYDSGLKIKS